MLPIDEIWKSHGIGVACLIQTLRLRLGTAQGSGPGFGSSNEAPDEEAFLRLAEEHEVTHLASGSGMHACPLSDRTRVRMLDSVRLRAAWNLVLYREMVSLSHELRTRGVEVLFYKGVVLCETLHGDLTTRPTRDMDILVRSDDFLRLRRELLGMGYTEDYFFPERNAAYYMGVNREAAFSCMLPDGVELTVEVHWAPVLPMYGVPFDNRPFFRSAAEAELGGVALPIPSLEHQFLLLLAHHGVSELWHSLRHLTDLAFFIERRRADVDWRSVAAAVERWGMKRCTGVGLALCCDLLGVAPPRELTVCDDTRLVEEMRMRLLATSPLKRDQIHPSNMALQLRLAEGLGGKARLLGGYFRKWASPSLRDLELLKLPPILFPLYYVLKPFRFLYARNG